MQRIDIDSPIALYRPDAGIQKGHPIRQLEKCTLVLGHALGANRHMWDEMLPYMPEDLDVVLWEQPGHGNSDLLDVTDPRVNDIADALADALSQAGVDKFHLAGLSLGGMAAIAFAEQHPQPLVSVGVLNALPALQPSDPWLERAKRVEEEGLEPLAQETMERWFTPSFLDSPQVEAVKQAFLATDPKGYAQCCRAIATTDLSSRVGEILTPALVLTGSLDAGVTPKHAAHLANQLGDLVGNVVVDDTLHMTAVEKPMAVAESLMFLMMS